MEILVRHLPSLVSVSVSDTVTVAAIYSMPEIAGESCCSTVGCHRRSRRSALKEGWESFIDRGLVAEVSRKRMGMGKFQRSQIFLKNVRGRKWRILNDKVGERLVFGG